MTKPDAIPAPAVRRLSLYLRQLEAFRDSNLRTVSSKQLGEALHITDAQVRKDLAYFGQFGHAGIGYDVTALIQKVREILGTDRVWNVLLVGAGNLGRALGCYHGFHQKGFHLVAVFDSHPDKIGQPLAPDSPLIVRPMNQLAQQIEAQSIRLAMLAVPAADAQTVADRLIKAGILGILNFAPVSLHVPPQITVNSVDLAVRLEQLSFNVTASQSG